MQHSQITGKDHGYRLSTDLSANPLRLRPSGFVKRTSDLYEPIEVERVLDPNFTLTVTDTGDAWITIPQFKEVSVIMRLPLERTVFLFYKQSCFVALYNKTLNSHKVILRGNDQGGTFKVPIFSNNVYLDLIQRYVYDEDITAEFVTGPEFLDYEVNTTIEGTKKVLVAKNSDATVYVSPEPIPVEPGASYIPLVETPAGVEFRGPQYVAHEDNNFYLVAENYDKLNTESLSRLLI